MPTFKEMQRQALAMGCDTRDVNMAMDKTELQQLMKDASAPARKGSALEALETAASAPSRKGSALEALETAKHTGKANSLEKMSQTITFDALAVDLERVASKFAASKAKVTVSDLSGVCHEVAISEADSGDSLVAKVRSAMALPASASVELYLSADGTPIDSGATTLAAQGIGDGAALDVVVEYPKCQAALTDHNLHDALKRWFDPKTRQAVVDEFGEIGDWKVGEVTWMQGLFCDRAEFNEDLSRWDTGRVVNMRWMFCRASSFNQPVEAWDTGRVENMFAMFAGASSFNQPVEAWDTGRVESMEGIFYDASSFNQHPTWLVEDDDY